LFVVYRTGVTHVCKRGRRRRGEKMPTFRLELVVHELDDEELIKDVLFEEVVLESPSREQINTALEELKWLWNK
jgi:hypothetical protein